MTLENTSAQWQPVLSISNQPSGATRAIYPTKYVWKKEGTTGQTTQKKFHAGLCGALWWMICASWQIAFIRPTTDGATHQAIFRAGSSGTERGSCGALMESTFKRISVSRQIAFIRQIWDNRWWHWSGYPKEFMPAPGHVAPSGVGAPSDNRIWNYGGRSVPVDSWRQVKSPI